MSAASAFVDLCMVLYRSIQNEAFLCGRSGFKRILPLSLCDTSFDTSIAIK